MKEVSILIPCYNAERWLREALESCLAQTYPNIEVIVVDDGSTDSSLAIAESYCPAVRIVPGAHSGGNVARNRGLQLSAGDFIQYLDADDYLLPEKIERQVHFLETEGGDVVYGDWRVRRHRPDGSSRLEEINVTGAQKDILDSLLRGWYVLTLALLHRREAVERVGGWDEQFLAAQDKDFMISEVLAGADVRYQSGCFSIYRRYGNSTVSTSNPRRRLEAETAMLRKAEQTLRQSSSMGSTYLEALAQSYYRIARGYYDIDQAEYRQLRSKAFSLVPDLVPAGSRSYNLLRRAVGLRAVENLTHYKRMIKRRPGERT